MSSSLPSSRQILLLFPTQPLLLDQAEIYEIKITHNKLQGSDELMWLHNFHPVVPSPLATTNCAPNIRLFMLSGCSVYCSLDHTSRRNQPLNFPVFVFVLSSSHALSILSHSIPVYLHLSRSSPHK